MRSGWAKVQADREITEITEQQLADFLYFLLEHRGDFGRLLCVLADVERQRAEMDESGKYEIVSWWHHPEMKARVRAALQRCVDSLDKPPPTLQHETFSGD